MTISLRAEPTGNFGSILINGLETIRIYPDGMYEWSGTEWVPIGGGQMYGNSAVKGIFYNAQVISENILIESGQNGMSAGPIAVADGFSVEVADGSAWGIV